MIRKEEEDEKFFEPISKGVVTPTKSSYFSKLFSIKTHNRRETDIK